MDQIREKSKDENLSLWESAEQLAQDKDTKVAKNIKAFFEIISQLQELDFNKDLDKFLENIDVIEKDLLSIFERNNIKKISTKDKKFDPNLHQAMTEIEDDKKEPGTVVQEIQSGYMLGERLLRPALVGVAKKKNPKNDEKNEKKEKK